jgi:hypothetical protein
MSKGRLPHAYGHPLALLATIAHAIIEAHIITDGPDVLQRCGPIADQGGAFDRGADLAVFDLIGLGAGKKQISRW